MPKSYGFSGSAPAVKLDGDKQAFIDGFSGVVTEHQRSESALIANPTLMARQGATNTSLLSSVFDASEPFGTNRIIRVSYPANSCSPGDKYKGDTPGTAALAGTLRPDGGTSLTVARFARHARRARMRFALKIPAGFDYRISGKLHGLSSYSTVASGGHPETAGLTSMTARVVWKAGGKIETYFYNAQSRKLGMTYGMNFNNLADRFLQTGWNTVELECWVNDVGRANGGCVGSLNGLEFVRRSDIEWRDDDSLLFDGVWFNTCFGGSTWVDGDNTYETLVDTALDFSDVYGELIS